MFRNSCLYDSYLRDGAFMPEATAAMAEAFDTACRGLRVAKESSGRALLATLIIAAARRGEMDPARLRLEAVVRFSSARLRAMRGRGRHRRATTARPCRKPLLKSV